MISLGRKKNAIVTSLAWVCLGIALMGAVVPNAWAQNKWGEEDPNPGEFGTIFGAAGKMNCKHWLSSPETEKEGAAWILGWWTAEAQNDPKISASGDISDKAVLAKVKQRCNQEPLMALTNAVTMSFGQLVHASGARKGKRRSVSPSP